MLSSGGWVGGRPKYYGRDGPGELLRETANVLYQFCILFAWTQPLYSVSGPDFQLPLLNARSDCKKISLICDSVINERANLAYITETCLVPEVGVVFSGWVSGVASSKTSGKGGRVAIVIYESLMAFSAASQLLDLRPCS